MRSPSRRHFIEESDDQFDAWWDDGAGCVYRNAIVLIY